MRLAPWSSTDTRSEEDKPLLNSHKDSATTRSGLLTNLISQDTYNIMSCVWVCHYIWAIPLKVRAIVYDLIIISLTQITYANYLLGKLI